MPPGRPTGDEAQLGRLVKEFRIPRAPSLEARGVLGEAEGARGARTEAKGQVGPSRSLA